MTPRQRWLALLAGDRPDRIPTDYQATPEVTARLLRELGCEDLERSTGGWTSTRGASSPLAAADTPSRRSAGRSVGSPLPHGRLRRRRLRGTRAPSAGRMTDVAQIDAYRWPDPDDFDYQAIGRQLDADDGYRPIHCGCYEPFLLYGYLRGLEQSFEDLALRPDMAEAILGHLFDFHYEHLRRSFEAGEGRIDLTWVAEDLGSQTGPLISLETYRRFCCPTRSRWPNLARSFGIHVMYHTDGAARLFLPDLIDRVGIEILNPIQWRCPGMEREGW
jgi:uroporphyrinogen decarboxylase